jgi:diamine N-acetyltransferase
VIRFPLQAPAFRAERYQLPALSQGQTPAELSAVHPDEAPGLAAQFSDMPPWSTYAVAPAHLEGLFRVSAGGAVALAVRLPGTAHPVGVAVVRWPWLIGPYMQFLGLDQGVQAQGLGTRVLQWLEAEARLANTRNLWICAAGFNDRAQRLYTRFGFEVEAAIDGLVQDGIPEILMRKRLR